MSKRREKDCQAKSIRSRSDNTNILRFLLAVIALGLILLFGLLFVVRIGGTTGWASFAVAGFVIMVITGISIDKIR